jgi:thioredoxin 1
MTINNRRWWKMRSQIIPIVIAVGVMAAVVLCTGCGREGAEQHAGSPGEALQATQQPDTSISMTAVTPPETGQVGQARQVPRLVDLGRGTCIPCKMMAPILEELKREYQGRALVEVIDLRDDPGAAREYGINLIPTQIFYDAAGEEVWRHEGFLAKDAIVAKLTEMGVESP